MINVILAVDKNFGIGLDKSLPWHISEELKLFKQKTLNSIFIVGRKTYESLPPLKDRIIFCVSKECGSHKCVYREETDLYCFPSFELALEEAKKVNKPIFVGGGGNLYDYVFRNYKEDILVHISFIKKEYKCDTYFDTKNLDNFYISKETTFTDFKHCEMKYVKHGECQYLNLLEDIIKNGERRVGRNGEVISDFCKHLKFDLRNGFPLLTTKKMFLKGIVEELIFFIRGDTNSKILENKGINIWKGNTSREFLDSNNFEDRKEGELGPMYGSQWRNFNSLYNEEKGVYRDCVWDDQLQDFPTFGVDQLEFVVNEIRNNPTSRRILMTTFNPAQVHMGVLWPCHSIIIQFYVQEEFLDMHCYNRSSDIGLGLPFNIASSSLLLILIAKITSLTPRYFNLSLGDTHIYSDHVKHLEEQIKRIPYISPTIIVPNIKNIKDIETLTYIDFKIENYNCYPSIKMPMIA